MLKDWFNTVLHFIGLIAGITAISLTLKGKTSLILTISEITILVSMVMLNMDSLSNPSKSRKSLVKSVLMIILFSGFYAGTLFPKMEKVEFGLVLLVLNMIGASLIFWAYSERKKAFSKLVSIQ
jgi:hypothetical protein